MQFLRRCDEDGVEIFDLTLNSLPVAESFFRDAVFDLGAYSGQEITFGYDLVADGPGGFGFDLALGSAVPEASTWASAASRSALMTDVALSRNNVPYCCQVRSGVLFSTPLTGKKSSVGLRTTW